MKFSGPTFSPVYMSLILLLVSCGQQLTTPSSATSATPPASTETTNINKANLGESLFSDQNLSLNRTISCATCHNPDHAFIDDRLNSVNGAVSVGQDNFSHGDRNSPTVTYAKYIPTFTRVGVDYFGGTFLDGRAITLTDQAKLPLLDSKEMQMPSKESVVIRVMENSEYIKAFKSVYGDSVLDNTDTAFNAIADAITEFEKSSAISPFDSKFDKNFLSAQEIRGRNLFRGRARCTTCHQESAQNNVFSSFGYQNIGIPVNTQVRAINSHATDLGLFQNTNVTTNTNAQRGRFRIATLRNVAVTSPYMHNGVFKELKTVVHFYNTRDVPGAINPETGAGWAAPEVTTNVVTNIVGNLGLTSTEEDDIVAFLRTLTDAKYEHLD